MIIIIAILILALLVMLGFGLGKHSERANNSFSSAPPSGKATTSYSPALSSGTGRTNTSTTSLPNLKRTNASIAVQEEPSEEKKKPKKRYRCYECGHAFDNLIKEKEECDPNEYDRCDIDCDHVSKTKNVTPCCGEDDYEILY